MSFFSKRALEQMKISMRGAYLSDFVDHFVTESHEVFTIGVDADAIQRIHQEMIQYNDLSDAAYEKALKKTFKLLGVKFERSKIAGYQAALRRAGIRQHYMSDMPLAIRAMEIGIMQPSEFVDYFLRTQLSHFEECEILLFIYPAKRDRTIEDYNMPRKYRDELTDYFYGNLKSIDELRSVVDSFIELHPYYCFYPFK